MESLVDDAGDFICLGCAFCSSLKLPNNSKCVKYWHKSSQRFLGAIRWKQRTGSKIMSRIKLIALSRTQFIEISSKIFMLICRISHNVECNKNKRLFLSTVPSSASCYTNSIILSSEGKLLQIVFNIWMGSLGKVCVVGSVFSCWENFKFCWNLFDLKAMVRFVERCLHSRLS